MNPSDMRVFVENLRYAWQDYEIGTLVKDVLAGKIYLLNATAGEIWDYIRRSVPLDKIYHDLASRYQISEEKAKHDVVEAVKILHSLGLLSVNGHSDLSPEKVDRYPLMKKGSNSEEEILEKVINAEEYIPINAFLELTKKCNLACKHCYLGESKELQNELSFSDVSRLLEDLRKLGTLNLILTGGEPFLRSDILEICLLARNMGFDLSIITNGTLLTNDSIAKIKGLNLANIKVSLHATSAEAHDSFVQVPGSFSKVISTLELLQKANHDVTIYSSITEENYGFQQSLHEFCMANSFKFKPSLGVLPTIKGESYPRNLMLKGSNLCDCLEYHYSHNPITRKLPRCGAAVSSLYISAEGEVQPCAAIPKSGGSIRNSKLSDVWSNSAFLKEVRNVTAADFPECDKCNISDTCVMFCIGVNFLENGALREIDKRTCEIAEQLAFVKERVQNTKSNSGTGTESDFVDE